MKRESLRKLELQAQVAVGESLPGGLSLFQGGLGRFRCIGEPTHIEHSLIRSEQEEYSIVPNA